VSNLRSSSVFAVPEPFTKAIRMFGHAAREELATPIAPATAEGLEWFFRERQLRQQGSSQPPDERFRSASLAYRAPRFRALFRIWLQDGNPAIWAAQSGVLKERAKAAWNSSNSRTSTAISPPWLASPDLATAEDDLGDNLIV